MAEASKGPRERPMSPHMTVWRWHITMAGSILHRVTGVGLYLGALLAAWWAFALASGPDAYAAFKSCMGSPLGLFVMFGMTLSFFYHLAAGVRHTVWDLGHGLTIKAANAITMATFAFAVAATLAVWFIASQVGAL